MSEGTDARVDDPAFAGIGERVERGLGRVMDGVGADDVFGTPYVHGDRLVITASVIERAGGFGFGGGFGVEQDEDEDSRGGGGGGGGGGSAVGRPVAVIDVGPEGTTVRPILDATRIGITVAMSLLAALGVARGVRRLAWPHRL